MPNFDNLISDKVVGDDVTLTRLARNLPVDQTLTEAWCTVMPNPLSGNTFLFQKHITTTPSSGGQITANTLYSIESDGPSLAGTTSVRVLPLPTTLAKDTILEFSGGARVVLTAKALQGGTELLVVEIDVPIVDGETAGYRTASIVFALSGDGDTSLMTPNMDHLYDIQCKTSVGKKFTPEDGRMNFRPQRTVAV